jgi:farnesyl diphosphate synthase
MSLKTELARIADDVDKVLREYIPQMKWDGAPSNVSRYAALDAGKRIRAFLTAQSAGLFGAPYESALRAGACIEMIHNFSLLQNI